MLALFGVPASQAFALSALFAVEGLIIHSTMGSAAFLFRGRRNPRRAHARPAYIQPRRTEVRPLECAAPAGLGRGAAGIFRPRAVASKGPPRGFCFLGPLAGVGKVVVWNGPHGPFLFVRTVGCDGVGLAWAADRPHRAPPEGLGYELVELEYVPHRGNALLRIYIDRGAAAVGCRWRRGWRQKKERGRHAEQR